MAASSGASAGVLVVANDPPELLDRYRTARNHLELERVLKHDAATLQLAVVFSDFDLRPEQARTISQLLPYILVDRWQGGERPPELPGIGLLLSRLSYFDRLVVLDESRWEQWRAQYRLPPVNREPAPVVEHFGGLEALIHPEASDRPLQDGPLISDPLISEEEEDGPQSGTARGFDLQRLKLMHLTETDFVCGFLEDLALDMLDSSQLRLLEFNARNGRWCHALRDRLRYLAGSDDDRIISQFEHDFGEQRCRSLSEILRVGRGEEFDLILAADTVNVGSEGDAAQLATLLSLARDGTRILLLEDFGVSADEAAPPPGLTIRAFEEKLWNVSQGRLLLDRCEVVRYPFPNSVATRALLQVQWLEGR